MAPSLSALRTRLARAAAGLILVGLGRPVRAATETAPPVGLHWGPLSVAPSLATGLFASTNPFNRSDASVQGGESTGDVIAVLNPAVMATLPFRNSWFRLAYDGVFRNYANDVTASNNSQDVQADLALRFSSFDQLTFAYDRQRGAADTIRFDGGEAIYDGTPYGFVTYDVSVQREVPGHLGYAANVRWSRLTFESTTYAFFEYDGWDGAFELRKAVSASKWILAGGAFRRFDHRLANDPTHSVYRQEVVDAVQVGMQGFGAHSQSWRVMLRYDWADYPGGTGSDFSGLGGEALLILAPGPSSNVYLYASRRNWASFYVDNNYYVATVAGVRGEKRWNRTAIGLDVNLGLTDYPDVVVDPVSQEAIKRRDVGSRGEFYASFAFRSAYALRVSFSHQGRRSNAGGVDYRGDALGVQFVLGWR